MQTMLRPWHSGTSLLPIILRGVGLVSLKAVEAKSSTWSVWIRTPLWHTEGDRVGIMILYYRVCKFFQLHVSVCGYMVGERDGGKVWKTPIIPCGLSGMTRICQERRGNHFWNDWGGGKRKREGRREWGKTGMGEGRKRINKGGILKIG